MAEYWKSLPRKFCDICKCWFADNKASIDFHERGKRHQENAQKRIQDIQKRGIKEFKKQKELENEMEKIEKAALAAYAKDLRNMQGGDKPQLQVQTAKTTFDKSSEFDFKPKVSVKNIEKKQKTKPKETTPVNSTPQITWYEAMTEEGYKYYWNSETSESKWEPPEEGFVSIEEQSQLNSDTASEVKQEESVEETNSYVKDVEETNSHVKDVEETNSPLKEESDDEKVSCPIGPQPKIDPYGQWVTVEKQEPVEYDLQLPAPSENAIEVVIPIHKEEPAVKFKEKVIGRLLDADGTEPGEVTFKKRKFSSSAKKNARQRLDDD